MRRSLDGAFNNCFFLIQVNLENKKKLLSKKTCYKSWRLLEIKTSTDKNEEKTCM